MKSKEQTIIESLIRENYVTQCRYQALIDMATSEQERVYWQCMNAAHLSNRALLDKLKHMFVESGLWTE